MSQKTSLKTFLRLTKMSRSYFGWYLLVGVLCVGSATAGIASTESLRRVMDAAASRSSHALMIALFYGLAGFLGKALFDTVKDYLQARLDQYSTMGLQVKLIRKIQRLSQSFIDKNHSGDVITRVMENTSAAQSGLNRTAVDLIQNILNVSFLIGYLIHLNWQLTIGTIVASLAIPAVLVPLSHYQKRLWDATWKIDGELSALVQDSVQGGEVTRAYGMADHLLHRFTDRYKELLSKLVKAECWNQSTNMSVWVLLVAGISFVTGYGGLLVARGLTTIGAVTAFLISFEQISFPISSIMQAWPSMQKSLGAADRVFELLDAPEQSDGWGEGVLTEAKTVNRALKFENIHFSYNDSSPVLLGVDFEAEPGKVTALVGESGSGKSTLLKLILGMYLPTGGDIKLGDTPVTRYALDSWRSWLGYVSQDICLFNGSIRYNIELGRLGASPEEIRESAEAANCLEFIDNLDDGIDTQIGEKGVKLSGGQRQRLAIARAIMKHPGLLLLDEATSALDNENEKIVQEALDTFCKDRTTIVVAHRLSTIMNADKIVFFENGRVAEEGTHDELIRMQGRYYRMFTAAYGIAGGLAV